MSAWIPVLPLDELPAGEARAYEIGGEYLALCRVEDKVYAVEDLCPHDTGPLGDGKLDGFDIVCPRHGARFDVRDGSLQCFPALCGIRSYPARVHEGMIEVELAPREPPGPDDYDEPPNFDD
ncbi:MAG: non-heme iron oxygenase ferredoxin subunit [Planctomycetota bacterium]